MWQNTPIISCVSGGWISTLGDEDPYTQRGHYIKHFWKKNLSTFCTSRFKIEGFKGCRGLELSLC